MSIPGTGLLAALRKKTQAAAETPPPDETKFAARSSAVHALEQAVAAGAGAESSKKAPRGAAIDVPAFTYDLDAEHPGEEQPELTFAPVTRVPAEYKEARLRQIAVSEEFITYGLKQGHIRVLHRFSEARALLKGHSGPIADVCFVGDHVLVAGGQDGELFAWRLAARDGDNAIHADQIAHAKFGPGCDTAAVTLAPLTDDTVAVAVGNAVVTLNLPAEGAAPLELEIDPLDPAPAAKMPNFPVQDAPTAVAGSPDGALLAAGSKHGRVYIARVSGSGSVLERGAQLEVGSEPIAAVGWLAASGDAATLLVSTANGTAHALFHTTDGGVTFTPGPTVTIKTLNPSFTHVAVVREQALVVLADTPRKEVATLHWTGDGAGSCRFDYLARFRVGLPILNFTALWNPDAGDDGAVELNCVQTEAVQQYFLDPALCAGGEGADGAAAAAVATPAAKEEQPASPPAAVAPPPPADNLLPPSPLINGAVSAATATATATGAADTAAEESQEEECPSPPASPAASTAAVVQVPVPITLPVEEPTPAPAPAPAAPTPKLLTPTDLLRASASPAAAAAPAPAPVKVLQRPAAPAPAPELPEVASPPAAAEAPRAAPDGDVAAAVAAEMSTVHRKFAGHVSAMYKELLKAMRSDLATAAAANERLLRESVAAQAAAVAAERAAVLAEERANMERLLAAISDTLNRDVPTRLGEAMRAQLDGVAASVAASIAPAVQAAVAAALPKETAAAVRGALDKQLSASLQAGLAKPLQDAFKQAFTKQVVPSFEAACQSMFTQVDRTLAKGLSEHADASRAALAEPAALAASLRESLAEAARLSAGGDVSAGALARTASVASSMRSPSVADVRNELRALVSQGHYENAFSKALGLQDVGTVGWLCAQVDAATVLSASPPALSQMVLLSLVQQLAADMTTGASSKLQWVREAALALNPSDPMLAPHLRPVLEQVHAALAAALPRMQGADVQSCKLAMHVVHSQMTS